MSNSRENPYGPRRLARDYVQHRKQEDRDEIRRRINKKGGSNLVSTWDEMEEIWLEGSVGDDDFEDLSVGLMDNTEVPPAPAPELPDDLTPDP